MFLLAGDLAGNLRGYRALIEAILTRLRRFRNEPLVGALRQIGEAPTDESLHDFLRHISRPDHLKNLHHARPIFQRERTGSRQGVDAKRPPDFEQANPHTQLVRHPHAQMISTAAKL